MAQPRSGHFFWLLYVVLVSALGGFLFGFDSGVISGCEQGIQAEYHLSSFAHGFTVSIALIGTIIGAFCVGRPSDWLGRKISLMILGVLFLISAAGCAFTPTSWPTVNLCGYPTDLNWLTLVIMRGIGGLAIGGASVVVPLYIVEIAPGSVRGRLVALNQFNIVLGILVSYITNYFAAMAIDHQTVIWSGCLKIVGWFTTNPLAAESIKWRLMLGVECIPAILFILLLFSIPESPRWLVRAGRKTEALRILTSVGDKNAQTTVNQIVETLQNTKNGVNIPLFQKKYLWPIFLAWAVAMFNQLSGINAINYYAPRIFKQFMGTHSALAATIGLGCVNLIFTSLAFLFIDRYGRRALLMFGALGTTAMHFLAAWQISLADKANPIIAISAILGFIAFFAVSQGAVIWVFISEIFPNAVRAKGQALGSFTHWVMCTIISWAFPVIAGLSPSSGSYAFGFFGCMTLLQFFFAWKLMPETKGGTIESLEKEIMNRSA
ncbi:MAG: sugar porter family MFS transporter [Thermoguttaceae bacterium]|nr:sugar porter family MFS transporter [Thermoguttaceae bacterium]